MVHDKFFDYLERLTLRIEQQTPWFHIKEEFYQLACSDDEATAQYIDRIDLSAYLDFLNQSMDRALITAQQKKMSAVYFEYDCYSEWNSNFFLCKYYLPKELLDGPDRNDDWACEFDEETITGPSLPEFSDLFAASTSDEVRAYLIALTVICFGEIYSSKVSNLALCIAFHDQDPIIRIQEFNPPKDKLFHHALFTASKPVESLNAVEQYVKSYYTPLLNHMQSEHPNEPLKSIISKVLFYYKDQIVINLCPFCGELRRTPRAKQCPHCFQRE